MIRQLTSCGKNLAMSAEAFGELWYSNDLLGDAPALRQRMIEDGYLFFRNLLDQGQVIEARQQVLESLVTEELLDKTFPLIEAVAAPKVKISLMPEGQRFPAIRRLLHSDRIMALFTELLGGQARVLDYIWLRAKSPGLATAPHCDIVYMSRGTKNLYTSWVPLGDVPAEHGSLIILEKSHLLENLKNTYGQMDIDKDGNAKKIRFRHGGFFRGGQYSKNPRAVQKEFGLRWLTTDFRAGDLVIFSVFTMHGTLDNASDRIRLSVDARYQLASEPVDERWVGEHPIAHSQAE